MGELEPRRPDGYTRDQNGNRYGILVGRTCYIIGWNAMWATATSTGALDAERKQLALALKRTKAQEDRVTDAYINEAMDLERYKAEMEKLRQRQTGLGEQSRQLVQRQQQEQDSQQALEHLERFCHQVAKGLDALTF